MPKTGVVTRGSQNGHGYMEVMMDGSHFMVHRLVAAAFMPQPDGTTVVNHINSDKGDNNIDNLEWTSQRENIAHAARAGRMRTTRVRGYDRDGHVVEYLSVAEASRTTGIPAYAISLAQRRLTFAGEILWAPAGRAPEPPETTPFVVASPIKDDDPIWAELGL